MGTEGMETDNRLWLLKSRYTDLGTTFRTTWDLYIKFYTVFLTFNIAALGFFLSSQGSLLGIKRDTLICVFAAQSALLGGTSILMAKYSQGASDNQRKIEAELLANTTKESIPGFESVFPLGLARWASLANAVVMAGMVAIWVSMFRK